MKKVLNVGGNNKAIPLPSYFSAYEHLLLDIDPKGNPDVIGDARILTTLESGTFDAVYCSHNLEHYYQHEIPNVLAGFFHVTKQCGVINVRVPDLYEVMKQTLERGIDIEDTLYLVNSRPIKVLDVIYGYGIEIERSGNDFYAHKTGFTKKSLTNALFKAGFSHQYMSTGNFELNAIAFKQIPSEEDIKLFKLPAS